MNRPQSQMSAAEMLRSAADGAIVDLRVAAETSSGDAGTSFTWPTSAKFKAVIFAPNQTVEFPSTADPFSSDVPTLVFQNGARFIGIPPFKKEQLVPERLSKSVLFGPDDSISLQDLPRPVFDKFLDAHKKLFSKSGDRTINRIELDGVTAVDLRHLLVDLGFYEANPDLPLENLCSRLDNFDPKNDSQKEIVEYAVKLLALPNLSRPAGLRLIGSVGTGKTHMSVAVAKEFMARGLPTNYLTDKSSLRHNRQLSDTRAQVWILDDVNSQYGGYYGVYKDVIMHVHQYGGRVFVTSNLDPAELDHGYFSNGAERQRLLDRSKGLFKTVMVTGESQRSSNPWHSE